MKNLEKSVKLLCPVCGNTMFEDLNEDDLLDDEFLRYRCANCNRVFTKRELLDENKELMDSAIEEMKDDAIKEIMKELKKSLR